MPLSPQITITPEDITYKSFDISAVTYTSTTATYTATGHTFSAGDVVQITGLAPDGYNGTYTITGVATNTFTVANTTNTALTDQSGNAYWADSTEYEYDGGQSVAYIPDSIDLSSGLAAVETMVNGKNKIYRQATAPTGTLTVGDIWFDTSNGNKQYYWNGTSWISVQDTAIATAQAAATAAQTTADGKNKIYRQGTTPTGTFAVGDIWFNTASDNAISRWDGSSWVATSLGNNALASISASKITAGTIDASVITVSNINAGNISTGYLAAARIATGSLDASVITAGTITASQIATGTITATQIAAGTITTDKLSAGTLTGFTVQTSSGSTSISMNAATNAISFKVGGSNVAHIVPLSTNGVIIHYGASADGSGGTRPQAYVGSTVVSLQADTSNIISASTSGLTFNGTVIADFNISSSNELRVPFAYSNTTANAATVWISSTGQLRRSTASSQRYKTDIVDLVSVPELDPKALYSLPVRAFRFKTEYLPETDDRANALVPGFIAEEVDAIYPIAADYIEGNGVETWNDRFIVPALLALVQEQNKRLIALEGGN